MRLTLFRAAFTAALMSLAAPALSGGVSDEIMAVGLIPKREAGAILAYDLERRLAEAPEEGWPGKGHGIALPEPLDQARLTLGTGAPGDAEAARLVLALQSEAGGAPRTLAELSPGGPNPVLLFWLENVVRAASVQTGGSPFWLRNRIRDALVAAEVAPDATGRKHLVLEPFVSEPEKARLGAFADLRLELTWDPAAPWALIELKAEAQGGDAGRPGGYFEHLTLLPEG